MKKVDLKNYDGILPKYPRTPHAPIEPNASRDDLIFDKKDFYKIVNDKDYYVNITEKCDGSNCGMTIVDGQPILRNRNHILNKAFYRKTPAKMQFSSIWTWFYSNQDKFYDLEKEFGFMPCLYGEWMFAVHSIVYDKLPDVFIPFDVYDPNTDTFVSPRIYGPILTKLGFATIPLLSEKMLSDKELLSLRDGDSVFSTHKREGIYIKVCDGERITHRFKMVRPGFIQGEHWNEKDMEKNKVIKSDRR